MRYLLLILILATSAHAAPILHSNPLAYNKLYMDTATVPWTATDDQIEQTWGIVAGAYAPFDIDVTTEYPGVRHDVVWVAIGGPLRGSTAGTSVVGNWHTGITDPVYGLLFAADVYADGLGNDPLTVARAIIHEAGHDIGLQHENEGYMNPTLGVGGDFWGAGINSLGVYQDSYLQLGGQLGYAPEPSVLWVGLMLLSLSQRAIGSRRCEAAHARCSRRPLAGVSFRPAGVRPSDGESGDPQFHGVRTTRRPKEAPLQAFLSQIVLFPSSLHRSNYLIGGK